MPKEEKFDPAVGSTVDKGIENASVPNVTLCLSAILHIALMTPMGDNPHAEDCVWGAPICVWGMPAVAKSDQLDEVVTSVGMEMDTIYPGTKQPEDFSGVLVPTANGVVIECLLGAVRRLNNVGRGVIFLDELGETTRATQGALLGFIRARRAGDTPLSPGIRIISAANPSEWSTSGFALESTTSSRMCHVQVTCPPVEQWIKRMISGKRTDILPNSLASEELVKEQWAAKYSYAVSLFTGYMSSQPLSLHRHPAQGHPQAAFCWANPRTWELAQRMYATGLALGYAENILQLVVEGCVSEGPATDFFEWVRNANLPKPEDVLTNGWKPDRMRLDVAWSVLASTTQYISNLTDKERREKMAIGAWKLYKEFIDLNMGDMVITSCKVLSNPKLNLGRDGGDSLRAAADPILGWMAKNGILKYGQS